MDVEEETP